MLKPRSIELGTVVVPEGTHGRLAPVAVIAHGSHKRAVALNGHGLIRVSQDDDGVYHDWQIGDGLYADDQRDADLIVTLLAFQRLQERQ